MSYRSRFSEDGRSGVIEFKFKKDTFLGSRSVILLLGFPGKDGSRIFVEPSPLVSGFLEIPSGRVHAVVPLPA